MKTEAIICQNQMILKLRHVKIHVLPPLCQIALFMTFIHHFAGKKNLTAVVMASLAVSASLCTSRFWR